MHGALEVDSIAPYKSTLCVINVKKQSLYTNVIDSHSQQKLEL